MAIGRAVRVVGGPERVPRRLGDALLADEVDAWARDVARAVDAISAPSTPVRGAATAGAREALAARGAAWDSFRRLANYSFRLEGAEHGWWTDVVCVDSRGLT